MKKLVCLCSLLALLLSLTGCSEREIPGVEMDAYYVRLDEEEKTPIRVPGEEALAACATVLKDIQSRKAICLYDQREFEGDGAFSPMSQILYWTDGVNWMEKNRADIWIPARGGIYDLTLLTYVSLDGEAFYGVENGVLNKHSYTGVGWWGEERPKSWLLTCDWDAQDVEFVEASRTETGKSYLLKFKTPYELKNYDWDYGAITRDYTVEFYFDQSGSFKKAVMRGDYVDMGYQGDPRQNVTITSIMSLVSTDAEAIAARIQAEPDQPYIKSVFDVPDRNYLF